MSVNQMLRNNFQPYTNSQTQEILEKNCDIKYPETKKMVLIVGANGSGKSTLIANLYSQNILNLPYVNADIFEKVYFSGISDDLKRSETAMAFTAKTVNSLIENGKSFCYESVFSHPSKLDLVAKAKRLGYEITAFYLYTEDYNINIARVQKRVMEGGHNVPKDKIIKRFSTSAEQSVKLISYCRAFYPFDNSRDLVLNINKTNNIDKNRVEDRGMLA